MREHWDRISQADQARCTATTSERLTVLLLRPSLPMRCLLYAAPLALTSIPVLVLALRGLEHALLLQAALALGLAVRVPRVRCESDDGEWVVVNRFSTRRFRSKDVQEYGSLGLLGVGPAGLSLRLRGSRSPLPFLVEASISAGSRRGVARTNDVVHEAHRSFSSARFVEPS